MGKNGSRRFQAGKNMKKFGARGKGPTKSKKPEYEKSFKEFQSILEKKGLFMRDVEGDGNCFFRALADQLEGDESRYDQYRLMAVDYVREKREYFEMFLAEDENMNRLLRNMEKDGTWGGNFEMVALSDVLKIKFCIHTKDEPPFVVKSSFVKEFHRNVHLAYHVGEHYSSIRKVGDNELKKPAQIIEIQVNNESDDDESGEVALSIKSNLSIFGKLHEIFVNILVRLRIRSFIKRIRTKIMKAKEYILEKKKMLASKGLFEFKRILIFSLFILVVFGRIIHQNLPNSKVNY